MPSGWNPMRLEGNQLPEDKHRAVEGAFYELEITGMVGAMDYQ